MGGTFTDGVLLDNGQVVRTAKTATDHQDLKGTLLEALDVLISGIDIRNIERVVLSTTLVTNLIATGQGEQTALILIPGPGMKVSDLDLPGFIQVVGGTVDFRGRIREPLAEAELLQAGHEIAEHGIKKVAVVGKFSGRNPEQEDRAARLLKETYPEFEVFTGATIAGNLNFPRRAVTAYYTAMTHEAWRGFVSSMEEAIRERGITCPLAVLKADGGTMDLGASVASPCETVFSGPAASAMGALTLSDEESPTVVVDIGGTTTDLALIINREPLQASKGARIEGRYSHINAVAVSSLPLGGDSLVKIDKSQEIIVGPERMGPAACYGGSHPTPTDAYNIVNKGILGNLEASKEVFLRLAGEEDMVYELAAETLRVFVGGIYEGLLKMFRQWEEEPAYRVWEIVNKRRLKPGLIVGVGAAAKLAVPNLAALFSTGYLLHQYTPVGNALGAAVARPTLQLNLHVDTVSGIYNCDLDGMRGSVPAGFSLKDAQDLAHKLLREAAVRRKMSIDPEREKVFRSEQFNVIQGWDRIGRIYDIGIKVIPGVLPGIKGVK